MTCMTSFNRTEDAARQRNAGRKPPDRLMVVDTDPGVCWALDKGLGLSGYQVRAVRTAEEFLRLLEEEPFDCILMELLPEVGLTFELLSSVLAARASTPFVCTSADPTPDVVIECMRRGATDFLAKPYSLAEVRSTVANTLKKTARSPLLRDGSENGDGNGGGKGECHLVGVSPAMRDLWLFIQRVAETNLNCLIRGESGVGKDMIARETHRLSPRSAYPFVKVNCTALPETLLESELFGYEKGAFTGASTSKPGRFSLAHEGIIFLDEIGDMQPSLQAKILEVIEHKEFTTVGGTKPTKVDVQIIAATNADLEKRTAAGAFRKDLYFRLNEISIWVPPLRERKEDVPFLVQHFMRKHARHANTRQLYISGEDIRTLSEYSWPGNVRELENTIKRWLVLGKQALYPSLLQTAIDAGAHVVPRADGEGRADSPRKPRPNREATPEEILAVLEQYKWNRRKAAEALGIGYQALRHRIAKFNIDKR